MPTFQYKTTVGGKTTTGEVEADNEQGAQQKLSQKSIKVDSGSLKKKGGFLSLSSGKKKGARKITERDIVIFTRQFSTMVDAGLPLVQCLEILGKQSDNPTFGDIIMDVKQGIEVGGNLSDSMRRHPKVWDALY